MKNTVLKLFLVFLLTLSVAFPVAAQQDFRQWSPTEGVSVRQGSHIEWYRGGEARDEGELAGEVAAVWSDCRFGDRGVFAQMIDVDGNIKYENPGGLLIADSTGRQEDPGIWPDPTDGGWFIAWEDFDIWYDAERDTMAGDSLGDIYCTKIDRDGNVLWGDDGRGVPVVVFDGIQEDVRIVHDGQGGCIIAWRDMRGGDTGDLYAMRILANGTPDPDWPENGMIVVAEPGAQTSHTADVDGAGGMIIGWADGRIGGDSNIWAQRITPAGTLEWGDGQGVPICNHSPSSQEAPKLCPDGAGGAFFSWVDNRNANQGRRGKDIYVQRIDRDGDLMWGEANEGVPLCTAEEEQLGNRIVISEPGTAIVAWDDKRGNGEEYDIYSMRITGVDQMRKTWQNEQGEIVVVEQRGQAQVRLYPDGQGGAFYVWEDERDGGFPEIDIWAQRLNANGQRVWAEEGVPVVRLPGTQNGPLIRRVLADGGCMITWADTRSGSVHLYTQRLTGNGAPVWQENGVLLAGGFSGNALRPKFIPGYNGEDTFGLLWQDGRFGGRGPYPFFQYCEASADEVNVLLEEGGRSLMAGDLAGGGIDPVGCSSSDGGIMAVWEDHRQGQSYAIYAQKASTDGQLLWGENGVRCADFNYDQNAPKIISDDNGGAIVIWKAVIGDGYYDIYGQRLDPNGNRLWGAEGVLLSGNEVDEAVEQIVPDGEGGAVIVWLSRSFQFDDDLMVQRINSNGETLWDEGGKILIRTWYKQRDAVLLQHQDGFFVGWVDGRDDENGQSQDDIYGQFIEPDGTYRWGAEGVMICGADNHQQSPTACIDNNGHIWVAWEDYRVVEGARKRDIFVQKVGQHFVDGHAREFFASDGMIVCSFNNDQAEPQMIHDGNNGVYLTWEDYRGGIWSDVYATHLRPNGTPYPEWANHSGNIICGATHKQDTPQVMLLGFRGGEGAVFTWEDKRATGKEELSNVFVQNGHDGVIGVDDNNRSAHPLGYVLESIYPNPFNSQTLVTFTTPREGIIKLAVYDINGRLVHVLDHGFWSAGRHLSVLDGNNLAAGTYIVRMTAGDIQLQKKIHLIK